MKGVTGKVMDQVCVLSAGMRERKIGNKTVIGYDE